MSKNWLYVHEGKTRKVKKAYYVLGGKTHAIKKAYVVKDGLTHLFYAGGGMEITYTGTHTISDVTKDGVAYKLYTMTGSGTLTIDGDGTVQYWMCGGGSDGDANTGGDWYYGDGGPGAFTKEGNIQSGTYTVTVGAKQGSTSISGVATASGVSQNNNNDRDPQKSGTASGAGGGWRGSSKISTYYGDGISKYPFGITSLYAHCAGGAGGNLLYTYSDSSMWHNDTAFIGVAGASNGGNTSGTAITRVDGTTARSSARTSKAGGTRGGGNGGTIASLKGGNATFYGSGAGGDGYIEYMDTGDWWNGGGASSSGYQGVCYLLVPADLLAA